MESAMPRRSVGTWSGSKPLPSSRTTPASSSGSTSTCTETRGAPECLAALNAASWQASTRARPASSSGASPTTTMSTGTLWRCSTRVAIASTAGRSRPTGGSGARYSQARSSRSCRRASPTTSGEASARWIRARVCRTESWRWAAISARASERIRPRRSSASWAASRVAQGAKISTSPIRVMATPRRASPAGAGVGEPEAEAAGHQQAADHDPDQADPAGEHGLDGVAGDASPAGPVPVVAAGPDDRRAGRGQGDRPDDLVAEPQADLAQQQHRPEHHQPEGEGLPGRRPADGPGPGQLVVRLDRDRPGQQVEHDPGAAGDGQDGEGDPDKDRVDAEPFAQPAGHAQQHAVVAAADDRRRAGRPLGDLGRRGSSPPRVGRVPGGHGGTRPSARPWGSTLSGRGPDRGSARVIPDGGRAGGGAGCSTNVPSPHEEQPHVRASPRGPARGA